VLLVLLALPFVAHLGVLKQLSSNNLLREVHRFYVLLLLLYASQSHFSLASLLLNHHVVTTLNGTQLDTVNIPKYFKDINISIDTLDEELCNKIGRVNLPKVLKNISDLREVSPSTSISIRTVHFNQPLDELKEYVKRNNFKWFVQPVERKEDYVSTYKNQFINIMPINTPRKTLCSYLTQDRIRYYKPTGLVLPCCFIKDTTGITTIDNMKHSMPRACNGCNQR